MASCCNPSNQNYKHEIARASSYANQSCECANQSALSASESEASAEQAAISAAQAAVSAELCGIYLGAFAVAPTTDNAGGPLQDGMLYYNTVSNTFFVWNGSSWSAIDDDEIYLGGFAVAPTLNNQGLPLALGNLYWNSVSNNLWAYDGVAWVATNFNEFTQFLAAGTTTARNLVTREADVVNVKDFGAVGDGVADDTAAIQAAINAGYGKAVYIPAGTYLVTSTITINNSNITIYGDGYNSVIQRTGDYGNTFQFGSSARIFDIGFHKIQILSQGLTTSGAHVFADGVWRMNISEIYIQDGFIGFQLNGLVASNISKIYLVFTTIYGGSSAGRKYMAFGNASIPTYKVSGDVFVTDFNLRGNTANQITQYGLEVISSDGLWFENGHIGNTTTANIHINGNTSEMLNLLFFSNVMSDEGTVYSLLFDGNVPSIYNLVQFSNCTFKSGGIPSFCQFGIVFAPNATVKNVLFTGCNITEFGRTGVITSGANHQNIYFDNCNVFTNGSDTTATFPGYNLLSGSRFIGITGGRSSGTDQSYGIQLDGSHTNIVIDSVDLTGNATDSINGYQSSVNVSNCLIQGTINVASASTITPPLGENIQYVTGTTNINNISASNVGRIIVLNFQDILTVNDGVGNLQLNGNFTTSADDTLTLVYNGAEWVEIARSTN